MSDPVIMWRVSYQDRISPNRIWTWDEENEERARERYNNAVDTESDRLVRLERVTWVISERETLAETMPATLPMVEADEV